MFSLFIRNLIFTILHPGIVAGLMPYWILRGTTGDIFDRPFQFLHYTGIVICIIGLAVMTTCIVGFAVKGQGTLSPFDPKKKLVATGLYRFSRNPMYIGVMLILIGETVFFQSVDMAMYSVVVFIGFNIFILIHEEPRMKRDFGDEYKQYCGQVRRWI